MRTRTSYVEEMCKRLPELTKRQVEKFLQVQEEAITEALSAKEGKAWVLVPGVVKITSVDKAATPERKARNPFSGGDMVIPAKPASRKLRAKFTSSIRLAIGELKRIGG
jgi:nucleoid DNA-binding protein